MSQLATEQLLNEKDQKIAQLERALTVEAALEKVRAASMAMHKSEELPKVAEVLVNQMTDLGLDDIGFGINTVIDEATNKYILYAADPVEKGVKRVMSATPVLQAGDSIVSKLFLERAEKGEQNFTIEGDKEQVKEIIEFRQNHNNRLSTANAVAALNIDKVYHHFSLFHGNSNIVIITKELLSQEFQEISKRFADVLGQSYIRFLDLQKAEAQARETQIEDALERVRNRALAMRSSDELKEVIIAMRRQIDSLGQLDLEASVIHLYTDGAKMFESFAAVRPPGESGEIVIANILFPVDAMEQIEYMIEMYHSNQSEYTIEFDKKMAEEWQEVMVEYAPMIAARRVGFVADRRTSDNPEYWNFADFSHGSLLLVTHSPASNDTKEVLRKGAQVFDQAYTRFLDLQKAEAQAREAQIEAALERVRAQTMAMHNSEELNITISRIFKELTKLELPLTRVAIWVFDKKTASVRIWIANPEGDSPLNSFFLEYNEFPNYLGVLEAWKKKEKFWEYLLIGEEKKDWADYLFNETDFSTLPEEAKEVMRAAPKYTFHASIHNFGCFHTTVEEPLSKKQLDIYNRFGNVFEQTYTRFLDLQRAEAQAREAQIEAALERVRARAMAMHSSDQLIEVASELRNQLSKLDQEGLETCAIHLYDESPDYFLSWAVLQSPDSSSKAEFIRTRFPKKGVASIEEMMQRYHSKENDYVIVNDDEKFYGFLLMLKQHAPDIHKVVKNTVKNLKKEDIKSYWSIADFEGGSLVMSTMTEPSENTRAILRRFANVFNQAYTRFLDLQKAEAQAREAQIEAALERVRASTMAMHHSSDLTSSAGVLLEQIQLLGAKVLSSGFVLCETNNPIDEQWMYRGGINNIVQQYIPHEAEPVHNNMFKAWQAGEKMLTQRVEGETMVNMFQFLMAQPSVKANIEKMAKADIPWVEVQILHSVNFSQGYLLIVTEEEYPEKDTFIRFAKVFEQTYTRFLDLQKAEAQAREAQIEAALERVRAASMAMHKSDELRQVVGVFYQQLGGMELVDNGFDINLFDEPTGMAECYMSGFIVDELPESYTIQFKEATHWLLRAAWNSWKKGEPYISFNPTGQERIDFANYLMEHTSLGKLPDDFKEMMRTVEVVHLFLNTKYGQLHAINSAEFSEESIRILRRFANVFEQTYTRFLDLQKAETQAREAQIEAALEKIRNRTLLMKDSSELNEAVATFFQQFKSLDLLPGEARAFFAHINETELVIQAWMTRMDGTVMSGSHFTPLDAPSLLNFYDAWKRKTPILIRNYEGEALKNYLNFVASLPHVKKDKDYQQLFQSNPERVVMTDAFFLQGSINMMTFEPLSQEAQAMLIRFAKVFEFTYTRFLDLQKAEAQAREAQIEAALERVRAKAMSMHKSEDLAEVLNVIFEQMHQLGFDSYHTIFGLIDLEKKVIEFWSQGLGAFKFPFRFEMPIIDNYVHNQGIADWQSGKAFSVLEVEGATKREYDEALFKSPDLANLPETVKNNIRAMEKAYFSQAFTQHGSLYANGPTPLPEENRSILVRFAKVLDLTYTRMLDLQKAETQAQELEIVFQENERLLHSILPMTIAEQLKKSPQTIVKRFEEVSILFADIVGFTVLSERLTPQEVVDILNGLFSKFDDLTDKYQLEKIKTIGDAYMVAAGVPEEKDNHAQLMFAFAKDMLQTIQDFNQIIDTNLKIRIGISSGPVVAGVIGKKKFAYDLWGDTVNTAARMEAYGRQDCIQVSPTTYAILKKEATFEKIPNVAIKGKGTMDVYLWTAAQEILN